MASVEWDNLFLTLRQFDAPYAEKVFDYPFNENEICAWSDELDVEITENNLPFQVKWPIKSISALNDVIEQLAEELPQQETAVVSAIVDKYFGSWENVEDVDNLSFFEGDTDKEFAKSYYDWTGDDLLEFIDQESRGDVEPYITPESWNKVKQHGNGSAIPNDLLVQEDVTDEGWKLIGAGIKQSKGAISVNGWYILEVG